MTCKGCLEEVDQVSGAGFCSKGICSIMEQGYLLGLQDVSSHMVEQARQMERIRPASVDVAGAPRAEITILKVANGPDLEVAQAAAAAPPELEIVRGWP